MKTRFILLLSFLYCCCNGYAQNLVPNPSFEEYSDCPDFAGQIDKATGWYSASVTPDYFNTCDTGYNWSTVPHNYFGYRQPASGNAYAGFVARWAYTESLKEAIGLELLSPLQIGVRYYASFKVSAAGANSKSNWCAVNKLGIIFSTQKEVPQTCNNCAHVYSDSIISDTLNWTRLSGSFVADSNYSFISIGRFNSNSLTDSIQLAGNGCNAYYYLDDVCISPDSNLVYNYTYNAINDLKEDIETINCFPNPFENSVTITDKASRLEYIIVCDFAGRRLRSYKSQNLKEITIDLTDLSVGTYNLIVYNKNFTPIAKTIIKL